MKILALIYLILFVIGGIISLIERVKKQTKMLKPSFNNDNEIIILCPHGRISRMTRQSNGEHIHIGFWELLLSFFKK